LGDEGSRVIEADEQLLERVRRGDGAAFETLFLRYYAQVFRVLHNLLGKERAEDVAQETFLTLYHNPPQIESDRLIAWLCRVAINRGYNILRGDQRESRRLERAFEPPMQIDPHTEALRAEERAGVRTALARLPERQARLLLLRHAGLSYAEIAAVIDVAPGSVGTLLSRAERAFLAVYEQLEWIERTGSLDVRSP
jgi:RNA polymerase sigma-70 factor (ECF subfamily)